MDSTLHTQYMSVLSRNIPKEIYVPGCYVNHFVRIFLSHLLHYTPPQILRSITLTIIIIIIIIIFLHGLGRLTCSGIDALPSFPRASMISSSSRFIVEGVFRESGVAHSFKMVDPVLFVFGSHVLYSRDRQFFYYNFASYFV